MSSEVNIPLIAGHPPRDSAAANSQRNQSREKRFELGAGAPLGEDRIPQQAYFLVSGVMDIWCTLALSKHREHDMKNKHADGATHAI